MRIQHLAIIILGTFLLSCGDTSNKPANSKKDLIHYNYIVLLDLSDRILKEDQINRDKAIISSIHNSFLEKVRKSFYINSKDQFRVVLPFQKEAVPSSQISQIEDDLYFNVDKIHISERKDIRESKPFVQTKLNELYELARFSENPNDYNGADIHGYLRDRLNSDLSKDPMVENKLIILTDGYMYIEGKSPGIDSWDPVADLSNVSVAIIEVDPSKNRDNELSRIKSAWENWMNKMSANKLLILQKNALGKVSEELDEFIGSASQKKKIGKVVTQSNHSKEKTPSIQPKAKEKIQEAMSEENESDLESGKYYTQINGKLRAIEILEKSQFKDIISFKFNYIPMGERFKNLKGSYNLKTRILDFDKLGKFNYVKENGYLILKGIEDERDYKKKIK